MTMDRVVSDGGTAGRGASTRRMSPPSQRRFIPWDPVRCLRPVARPMKEPGILDALGQAVKDAAVERKNLAIGALTAGVRARREREEREREERLRQVECARMAGRRVTSGEFGASEVEIYENGYVRVAGPSEAGRLCRIDESTPYENLISISFESPDSGSSWGDWRGGCTIGCDGRNRGQGGVDDRETSPCRDGGFGWYWPCGCGGWHGC